MGEFADVEQKLKRALGLSGQPVKRGTMAHDHHVYMILADTAAQLEDAIALRQYTPLLEELALRDNHRHYRAIAQRAHGVAHRLAGDYTEAEECLNQALELFGESMTPWQIGRTLFELAELDTARSNKVRAREYLSRALEEFETMKAMPDVERTRLALEALG